MLTTLTAPNMQHIRTTVNETPALMNQSVCSRLHHCVHLLVYRLFICFVCACCTFVYIKSALAISTRAM
jgi:hypothetical protein